MISRFFPLLAAFLLVVAPARLYSEDYGGYRFVDPVSGEEVHFPDKLPVYTKESPGPWKGLEADHAVAVESRLKKEGLETRRIVHLSLSPGKDTNLKAVYVLDKDQLIIGYHKINPKKPVYDAEINITSVINYIQVYVECAKHGLWRKSFRFTN